MAGFQFKQFEVWHEHGAMKVTTDACLLGAYSAKMLSGMAGKALDIGCGTGLLALMLAQASHKLEIDAIELDDSAAREAEENVQRSPFSNIRVITADVRDHIMNHSHYYHFIVCNPPFFENQLKSPDKHTNRARHSSHLTLEQLIHFTAKMLMPGGKSAILIPAGRIEELNAYTIFYGLTVQETILLSHSYDHKPQRAVVIIGTENITVEQKAFTLMHNNRYTEEAVDLLKDYYLYL